MPARPPPARPAQGQEGVPLIVMYNKQADKIMKLSKQYRLEIGKRDKEIKGLKAIVQKQRMNLVNQQLDHEKLSHKFQSELLQRGKLNRQICKIRHSCSIVVRHCDRLSETLKESEDEKDALNQRYTYNVQMKDVECSCSSELPKLKLKIKKLQESLEAERADRAKKDAESSAEKASLENTLKENTDALQVAETAAEANNNDLSKTKENLKEAVVQRDNLNRAKEVERRVEAFNQGGRRKSRPPLKTRLSRQNVVAATSSNIAAPTTPLETPPKKKAHFSSSGDSPLVPPKTPKRKSFVVANAFGFDDDD